MRKGITKKEEQSRATYEVLEEMVRLKVQEYIQEIQQQKQALEHRTAELNQANEQLQREITVRKQTEEELKT